MDHDRDGRHQNFVQNDAKFGHFEDHQRGFYVITETLWKSRDRLLAIKDR